jgi:AraC family transcriptional regulator
MAPDSRPSSSSHYLGQARHDAVATGVRVAEFDATIPFDEVPEHEHQDAHLVFVLAGAYASSARHMPEAAAPMAAVANPPGTVHRDRFLTLPGRYLVVELDRDLWHSAPGDAGTIAHRMGPDTAGLLLQLHCGLAQRGTALDRWAEERALELCARATGCGRLAPAVPTWLDRVRDRLRSECTAPPSLIEVARDAGVHPTSLSRAFRRRYGLTISAWIRACRVEHAAWLLQRQDASLADAALAAGFSDQAHLTRELRRAMNLTPAVLRRRSAARNGPGQDRSRPGRTHSSDSSLAHCQDAHR